MPLQWRQQRLSSSPHQLTNPPTGRRRRQSSRISWPRASPLKQRGRRSASCRLFMTGLRESHSGIPQSSGSETQPEAALEKPRRTWKGKGTDRGEKRQKLHLGEIPRPCLACRHQAPDPQKVPPPPHHGLCRGASRRACRLDGKEDLVHPAEAGREVHRRNHACPFGCRARLHAREASCGDTVGARALRRCHIHRGRTLRLCGDQDRKCLICPATPGSSAGTRRCLRRRSLPGCLLFLMRSWISRLLTSGN